MKIEIWSKKGLSKARQFVVKLPSPMADSSRLEPLHFVVNPLFFWKNWNGEKIFIKKMPDKYRQVGNPCCVSIVFNSQTCLNSQTVATGAFWLEVLASRCTARVSSLLRGSLVWRGRWSTSMGYCAGMLAHLDPRLGMVREYEHNRNHEQKLCFDIFEKYRGHY